MLWLLLAWPREATPCLALALLRRGRGGRGGDGEVGGRQTSGKAATQHASTQHASKQHASQQHASRRSVEVEAQAKKRGASVEEHKRLVLQLEQLERDF